MNSERGEYVQYAFLLHPEITEEVAMANRFRLPRRNMELIAQYLGRDLVPFISSEDRLRDLPLEDRLHDLSDEDRRALLQLLADQERLTPAQRLQGLTLEDIHDALSDEERRALRQLLDGQESAT